MSERAKVSFRRDSAMKPRKVGTRDPKELKRVLEQIYPAEVASKLFDDLCGKHGKKETEND